MIAIIYDHKTESTYVSPVFAIKDGAEVIAFNADRTAVRRIKACHVYVVSQTDGEFDGKSGKWRGYSWVIGDENLKKSLKYGKSASVEDFPEFKKYTDEILLPEWFEVRNKCDVKTLEMLAADLIDGEWLNFSRNDSDIEVKIDTSDGGCINIRLIDIIDEAPAEFATCADYNLVNYGIKADEDGFTFLYVKSQIKCKRMLWNLEVATTPYLRSHDGYPDISAFYEDVSKRINNAELIGGKLIINANERIEAELKNGEYVITVNGKREKGSVEDQDIYYHLLEYVYGGQLPPPVWEFSHSRFVSLMNGIRASIIPAIFAVPSFAVAVTSESKVGLIICSMFFAIVSWIIFIIISMALSNKITYEINDSVFIIHRLGITEILPLAAVKEVVLKRSRIFKKRGTVKIKADGKNYYFRFVTGADEAYELIRERINDKE